MGLGACGVTLTHKARQKEQGTGNFTSDGGIGIKSLQRKLKPKVSD